MNVVTPKRSRLGIVNWTFVPSWLPALVVLFSLALCSEAQVNSSSRSSASSSSSASPKKKCCYCIAPSQGNTNATEFMEYCTACLMNPTLNPKVASCDIRESVTGRDFKGPDSATCSSDLLVYNLEHGPIPGKVFHRIEVCVKNVPSCALEFQDLSCETLHDPKEVKGYLDKLQKSMGPDATVLLCGNASSNYPKAKCGVFEAARETYIVSANKIENPPNRCPKSFSICNPAGYTHTCLSGQNELKEQVCCERVKTPEEGFEYPSIGGVWGEPGAGCSAFPSCPPNCTKKRYCADGGSKLFMRQCIKLQGGDYACILDSDDCKSFGRVCDPKNLMCDDPPKKTSLPGSSASSSPKASSNSPQSIVAGGGGDFIEVNQPGQEYLVSAAWLSVATTPKNLFGSSTVIEVGGSLAHAGILLHTVDPSSTLGALRFASRDIIHFVNDTPIRSRGDLVRNLSPALQYLGITYTRGSDRRLVTVRVGASRVGLSK